MLSSVFGAALCLAQTPDDFQIRIRRAAKAAQAVTVAVSSESKQGPSFGAGTLVDSPHKLFVTNFHVVAGSTKVSVKFARESEAVVCKVVRYAPDKDLALLQAEEVATLPPAILLATDEPEIGDFVLSAGSPGGYEFSVTFGMVGDTKRSLKEIGNSVTFIQVDAPMFEGSSGGPLVNLEGRLLGINSRGGARGAAGFAVPARYIRELMDAYLKDSAKMPEPRAHLDATLQAITPELRGLFGVADSRGVIVAAVHPGGAAEKAHLRVGDVIVQIDRLDLTASPSGSTRALVNLIHGLGAGAHRLMYVREGKSASSEVNLTNDSVCEKRLHPLVRENTVALVSDTCSGLPAPSSQTYSLLNGGPIPPPPFEAGDIVLGILDRATGKTIPITDDEQLLKTPQVLVIHRGGEARLVVTGVR